MDQPTLQAAEQQVTQYLSDALARANMVPLTFPPYSVIDERINAPAKIHFYDGSHLVDGAAYVIDAVILDDGFTANILVKRIDPTGHVLDGFVLDMRQAEAGAKADSVSIAQSGPHLVMLISYHIGDFHTRRIYLVVQDYLHPYGPGMQQLAMPGAFVPTTSPDPAPQPGGLDEAQTITAVKKALGTDPTTLGAAGTLTGILGAGTAPGNDVRQTIRKLGADVFIRFLDSSKDTQPGQQDAPAFRYQLFTFFRNALYGLMRKHIFGNWSLRSNTYEVETQDYEHKQIALVQYAMRTLPPDGHSILYGETLATPLPGDRPLGMAGTPEAPDQPPDQAS